MGEGKLAPLTTPTPLNRQSRNTAHVITSTISPDKRHLVKIAPGVTSPHIAKVTTHFFKISFFVRKNLSTGLELRPLNRFCHAIYQRRVFTQGSAFWGSEDNNFTSSHSKPPKTQSLGTYNGKPMGNIYSHNCMMHKDTMLKFGALFELAKYFEHT